MVKYAEHLGYEVRNNIPPFMAQRETKALFNTFVARFLEREGIRRDAVQFDAGDSRRIGRLLVPEREEEPLIEGRSERAYPAIMVIRHKAKQAAAP
jgi:hypothetical protein